MRLTGSAGAFLDGSRGVLNPSRTAPRSAPTPAAMARTKAANPTRPNRGVAATCEAMVPRNPTQTRRIALVAVVLFTGVLLCPVRAC